MHQPDGSTGDDQWERSTLILINSINSLSHSPMHRQLFIEATGLHLVPADIRLVEFLSGQPPVPVSLIADALGIDLAQASRQVTRLADVGHLTRRPDPDDRRRTLATLTPTAAARMDDWLRLWSAAHLAPLADWPDDDITELAACVNLQVSCLQAGLPDQPVLSTDRRWDDLVGRDLPGPERAAGRAIVALVTWVGQSQGFDELLPFVDSPIRQATFLTLRTIVAERGLAVSEIAERMTIDPAVASKRVSELADLGLVERAPAPADRRRTLVRASAAGSALEQRVLDTQLRLFREILPELPAGQRRRWTTLIRRWVAGLDFVDDRGRGALTN